MTPPENDDEAVVAPPAAVRQLTGLRAARALAEARLRLVVPGRALARGRLAPAKLARHRALAAR
ncbi:MAG: hypothetical protein U0324_46915 [Polyangiales bacterium]